MQCIRQNAEGLLSAFDLASSRCSRHDVEASRRGEGGRGAGEDPADGGIHIRSCASERKRKRDDGRGREGATSFLVCILITSFCRKLLGIRDTQPRLGFNARTHPRALGRERRGEERRTQFLPLYVGKEGKMECRPGV